MSDRISVTEIAAFFSGNYSLGRLWFMTKLFIFIFFLNYLYFIQLSVLIGGVELFKNVYLITYVAGLLGGL